MSRGSRHLVLDVSALAINRTAMYFVVRDTARHLIEAGLVDEVRACGERIALAEFVANDYDLVRTQQARVLRRIGRLLTQPMRTRATAASGECYVVFDPLYLLTVPRGARALALVLDLTPITRPDWHDDAVSRAYARAFDELADPRVDVAAISHSTVLDLWANFGIAPTESRCIHLYNRLEVTPREQADRARSLLFVGSLEERKNVEGLILAFASSGLASNGYELRIVGADAHGASRIKSIGRKVPGVALCGRLDDAQLAHEYATCTALVYPSYWEGFGLPALEALAMGIPVLLSDCSALPEVGGQHATYVDPCNVRSIADGLVELVKLAETDDADAAAARVAWAGRFTRAAYLAAMSTAVTELLAAPVATTSGAHAGIASPPVSLAPSAPTPVRRSRRGRKILERRVLAATDGTVPGDSFSLDYLYCVQQEGRVEVSRRAASFRHGSILAYPWYAVRLLASLLRLEARNIVIRSMINETVSRRLHERFDDT